MNRLTNSSLGERVRSALSVAAAIVLLGACASTPLPPTAALNEAREAIVSAEQTGARQYAGAELDEAQQKLMLAERFVSNEQMIEAERLAREAMIVAELATAKSESAKALEINKEMGRGADALEEEMRRTGDQQ